MSLRLRSARPTDAGRAGAILHGFCTETSWMPDLHSGAEAIAFCGTMIDRGWMMVAECPQGVSGFLARQADEIVALYVQDQARGQGVGSALLATAKRSSPRLTLWTFQANLPARRFYVRHGFAELARTDGAGNDENLPDIHYVWAKGGTLP